MLENAAMNMLIYLSVGKSTAITLGDYQRASKLSWSMRKGEREWEKRASEGDKPDALSCKTLSLIYRISLCLKHAITQ